jgi:hypothetical protein
LKPVTQWSEITAIAPDLAGRIQARFESHPHHVLGTIRADGSPRLSGINVFFNEGRMWCGSMVSARKANDIRRDRRVALYSAPLREDMDGGDASVSGIAHPLDAAAVQRWRPESPSDGEFFEIDVVRMHLVEVVGDELALTMWDNAHGLRIVNRQ